MKPFCIIAAFIILLCASCRTAERTVQTAATQLAVRTDTLRLFTHTADTLLRRDSIFVREVLRSDTVLIERTHFRTDRIAAMRYDTVYISRTDTLRLYRSERNDTRGIPGSAVKLCLCLAAFAVLCIIVWIKKKKTW